MAGHSWIEERERRHLAAQPAPWPMPDDRAETLVEDALTRTARADGRLPLDHEGCDVWPWHGEENMALAYLNRNEEERVLAILKAAAALVEQDEPTCERVLVECIYCRADRDITPKPHAFNCPWLALVAALGRGGG